MYGRAVSLLVEECPFSVLVAGLSREDHGWYRFDEWCGCSIVMGFRILWIVSVI